MIYFAAALIAYLLGSIPFGFIAGRVAGTDVRQHGSGNIGATNTLRVLGKKYGYAVFVADVLKGFLAVRIALWLAQFDPSTSYLIGILAALFVVVGHSFPIWLGFRGGKGVAAAAGACLWSIAGSNIHRCYCMDRDLLPFPLRLVSFHRCGDCIAPKRLAFGECERSDRLRI